VRLGAFSVTAAIAAHRDHRFEEPPTQTSARSPESESKTRTGSRAREKSAAFATSFVEQLRREVGRTLRERLLLR
jgi:hypothetical protein